MPIPYEIRQSVINNGIVMNAPTTDVVWSIGRNVVFRSGTVSKTLGKTLITTTPDSRPVRELFTFRGLDNIVRTVCCCDSRLYRYIDDFTGVEDITGANPPSGNENSIWNFALVAGIPVLSNGVDKPWKWDYRDHINDAEQLSNLPVANAITTALNRLMLGGVTNFPSRVAWSSIGDPSSIEITPETTAGRSDIINPNNTGHSTIEIIRSFSQSGERKRVYTDHSIWHGTPVESIIDFNWTLSPDGIGLISPKAFVHINGIDFFMGCDDFYTYSSELTSIGEPIRNAVFPNLNNGQVGKSFAYYKSSTKEICFCFPTGSNTYPDTMAIFNLILNNWSFADVDYSAHTYGWTQTSYEWDAIPYGSWDTIEDSQWDRFGDTGVIPYEVVGDENGQIFKLDDGYNNNGNAIEGYIESGDIVVKRSGAKKNITVLRVVPHFKPHEVKTPVMVQVGTRRTLGDDIEWSQPQPFTVGVSKKLDYRKAGRYIRFRFFTDQVDSPWILSGFTFYFKITGGYY